MEILGITDVTAITILCYLAAEAVKVTRLNNKWLPIICGSLGGICGATAMYLMPDYPANDIITAVAIGIVSGLAATGANQIFKQMGGNGNGND